MGCAVLDQYAPFCYFLMRVRLPVQQTILPGLLRVESVSMKETEAWRAPPNELAALRLVADSDGRGVIALQSHMRVVPVGQRDVYALACSGDFAAPMEAELVHLHELREVLGALVEIRARPAVMPD